MWAVGDKETSGKSGLFTRFVKQTPVISDDKSCYRNHSLSRKGEEDNFTNENGLYKCKYPLQKGNLYTGFRVAHPTPTVGWCLVTFSSKNSWSKGHILEWRSLIPFSTMLDVPSAYYLPHNSTNIKEQSYSPSLKKLAPFGGT